MAVEKGLIHQSVMAEKRGYPVYAQNPSIDAVNAGKKKRVQLGDEKRGLIVDNSTGEIFGHGGAVAYEFKEVDSETFVKIYAGMVAAQENLTKAGLKVFALVYQQVRDNPNSDQIHLSPLTAGMPARTYHRGLRELLENQVLFKTPYDGTFFLNVRYLYNGDRLALVRGYRLKDKNSDQPELPLDQPKQIPTE